MNSDSDWQRFESALYVAFALALVATLGSLFFSEIMKLPPCLLCWYQRIGIYPLVPILGLGLLRRDVKVLGYALTLLVPGLAISVYHNLLYYKIIPESLAPCVQGISCTTRQIEWLGFITIPLLSLTAYVLLLLVVGGALRMMMTKKGSTQ